MNIRFEYLYRDVGNYKQFGYVVFTNETGLVINVIHARILDCLIDKTWFYSDVWGLKDLHLFKWDDELDHTWHEYSNIESTEENATMGDIKDFLLKIELAKNPELLFRKIYTFVKN